MVGSAPGLLQAACHPTQGETRASITACCQRLKGCSATCCRTIRFIDVSKLQPLISWMRADRKSTRLNSSHLVISYAVFCLKKKIDQVGAGPFLDIGQGHSDRVGLLRLETTISSELAALSVIVL